MKKFYIQLTTEELKYLSIALNNELTFQQPNLFKDCWMDCWMNNSIHIRTIEVQILSQCAVLLVREIATRVMNKYNSTLQSGRKKGSIGITEAEAYAIQLCHNFGGFNHFGDYESALFYPVIEKSNQLILSKNA